MTHSDRLGRFELVRRLASGGMAEVYLARVSGLAGFERHVVLKVLRENNAGDEAYVAMFLDEARLAAALHHQHIAQVYEVGCADDGSYFLAMEYVHGETVSAVLETAVDREIKLPLELALTVVGAAAAGLHHAHEQRGTDGAPLHIVHRDVTPSNVLVSYDGSVKLIDFGIAKAEARRTKTQTGFIKGKVGYMAPEQARGYPVDRRSDVFALGVLLYELTTQERAFLAETPFEITEKIVHGEVKLPSMVVPGYLVDLEDAVMTALEVDPDDRFQSADELRLALEEIARRHKLVLGGSAVTRCLAQLFGPRPEPWLPPRPPPRARRATAPAKSGHLFAPRVGQHLFARGSGTQDTIDDDNDDEEDDDDAITQPIATEELLDTGEPTTNEVVGRSTSAPPVPNRARPRGSTVDLRRGVLDEPSAEAATRPPTLEAEASGPPAGEPLQTYVQAPTVPRVMTSSIPSSTVPAAYASPMRRVVTPTPPPGSEPMTHDLVPTVPRVMTEDAAAELAPAATAPEPAPARLSATLRSPIALPPPVAMPMFAGHAPKPRSRRALPLLAASLLVGMVAGLAAVALDDDVPPAHAPDASPATTLPPAPRPASAATPPAVTPLPGSAIAPTAPAAAPSAPAATSVAPTMLATTPAAKTVARAPAEITLQVTTVPEGATVVLDGVRLGTTPFSGRVPARSKPGWLKVRLKRHVAVKTKIALDGTDVTWSVRLKPQRR